MASSYTSIVTIFTALLGFIFVVAHCVSGQELNGDTSIRAFAAAASGDNLRKDCLCQCSRKVFLDSRGRKHGNCLTTSSNGARWCYVRQYVDGYRTGCPISDLKRSSRFPNEYYSTHACATPSFESRQCQRIFAPYFGGPIGSPGVGLRQQEFETEVQNDASPIFLISEDDQPASVSLSGGDEVEI